MFWLLKRAVVTTTWPAELELSSFRDRNSHFCVHFRFHFRFGHLVIACFVARQGIITESMVLKGFTAGLADPPQPF